MPCRGGGGEGEEEEEREEEGVEKFGQRVSHSLVTVKRILHAKTSSVCFQLGFNLPSVSYLCACRVSEHIHIEV